MMSPALAPTPRSRAAAAILTGGGIAGVLDITYAIIFAAAYRGVAPTRLLQSVASGLLGKAAFDGGAATAALGLVLHFLIAFSWAAIFWMASRRWPALVRRPVAMGVLYGIVIYAVMNLVVVPLSATAPRTSFPLPVLGTGLLVHMFCIGLPIVLAARRASLGTPRPTMRFVAAT